LSESERDYNATKHHVTMIVLAGFIDVDVMEERGFFRDGYPMLSRHDERVPGRA
jgi:hypothetical protein